MSCEDTEQRQVQMYRIVQPYITYIYHVTLARVMCPYAKDDLSETKVLTKKPEAGQMFRHNLGTTYV